MKKLAFLLILALFIPSLAFSQSLPGYWEGGNAGVNKSPYSQPYQRTYPDDYRTVQPGLPGYFNPQAGSTTPYSTNPRGLHPLTPSPYQRSPQPGQR